MGMSTHIEFKWTDELVAEYSLASQSLTLWDFKRKKMAELESKPQFEIVQVSSPECGLYYLDGYKMRSDEKIYSIKRLSDNEIFTIDDKFTANAGCELTIEKFEISGDAEIMVYSKEYGFWHLDEIRKTKDILFITEDGVAVYSGVIVYGVGRNVLDAAVEIDANYIIKHDHEYYIYFSSKEKSQEYIMMNKPLFSISEIISDIVKDSAYKYNYTELLLKKGKEKTSNTK